MASPTTPAPRPGLSLSARLNLGFLLLAVPSLAVMVAISLYAFGELSTANRELREISRSLEAVQELETAIAKAVTPAGAFLADGGPEHRAAFQASILEVETRLKGCGNIACHAVSQRSEAMAESVMPNIRAIRDRAMSAFSGGETRTESGRVRVLHAINQDTGEVYRQLEHMASALAQRAASLEEASLSVRRRATTLILAAAALVLALAASGAWLLSRRLLGHVGALLTGTRRIIQGDLGHRLPVGRSDEIGQLARSFNAMAQEIQEHRERLTEIVEARTAELRQARDSLVQSEKLASIGLLAAGIAHELNNPLTSIVMNVGLLAEDQDLPAVLRTELRRIGEDTMRCRRIIDDLRGYARREELHVAPADLNALAQGAIDALERSSRSLGIDVTREFAQAIPLVPCDAARLEQVLANVLDNAVEAMPEGGRLTVGTALRAGGAEIRVQDSGPGVPEAIRQRIFDPFFTTKPHGTGLGLSIVYKIMQAHGGTVEVQSAAAGAPSGTRVVLWLPLERARPGHAEAAGEGASRDAAS